MSASAGCLNSTIDTPNSTSFSSLMQTAHEYLSRDQLAPQERPTGRELFSESKAWLKGLRGNRGRATSDARPPQWAQPLPDYQSDAWSSYYLSSWQPATGSSYAQKDAKLHDEPAETHWAEWNFEEAMRQATEASRVTFEDEEVTADVDQDIRRALAESSRSAEADEARRREAEKEEVELQAALQASARTYSDRQQPHRRGTTDAERAEIRKAMMLSLQDGNDTPEGPVASTSAVRDSTATDARSPPPAYDPARRPLPALPSRRVPVPVEPVTSDGTASTDAPDTAADEAGQTTPRLRGNGVLPPVPARPPPPLPTRAADTESARVTQILDDLSTRTESPDSFFGLKQQQQQQQEEEIESYFDHQSSGDPSMSSTTAQASSGDSGLAQPRHEVPSMPRVLVTTPPIAGQHWSPHATLNGSALPIREASFGSDDAADFVASFESEGEWSLQPGGPDLPYGGYRTKSPAQLSRLTERTELDTKPLPTPMSLMNDSTLALEGGDSGLDEGASRPPMQSGITQGSSVYVSAPESASDPSVEAAANAITTPGPFGETLRFGYEADGAVQVMNRQQGMPGVVFFSTETERDGFGARRPHGVFAIEAPTYTALVRGLMWYGNSRLESDRGQSRGEIQLIATFIGGTLEEAAHIRLSLSLVQQNAAESMAKATATPGRLRLPLPDRVLLPTSLAEIAVSLYTLRHLASIALSTQPSKGATTSYTSLRQLGTAIERLAQEHDEGSRTTVAEESKMLRRLKQRLIRNSARNGV